MARKREILVLPTLNDCGGDLTKEWYVEYAVRNPYTDEMKRFRHYKGFKKLKTAEERYALGEQIVTDLKERIRTGDIPFMEKKRSYQDELIYAAAAKRWGAERESMICIRTHLSEFLEVKKTEVIAHSFQTYRSKLRIFNEWCELEGLDRKHISFVSQQHICDFLRHLVEVNHISRRTVDKYKQILHGFFDYIIKVKQIVLENPVHNIPRMGEVRDEAPHPIPSRERKMLIAYMRKHDPQLMLVCLMEYYCAIRPNELRLLKIRDIDMEHQFIRVPKDISKNRMTESVNIPRQLLKLLQEMELEQYSQDYYLLSQGGNPGPTSLGKNSLRFRFDRIRNQLGISPVYKLYSFKHTGGVELVNAGVDTWELQRHFRHKSIDTTERYIRRNFAVQAKNLKDEFPDI